jgi:hypothetical protein
MEADQPIAKNQFGYQRIEYYNAAEFLAKLSPHSEAWHQTLGKWVFRGQRDADWGLIPSAFRPDMWKPFSTMFLNAADWKSHQDHITIETILVSDFARMADRQGLAVPGFDESWLDLDAVMQKYMGDINSVFSGGQVFPPPSWRPLFAMAQHYGVPTRLLDWSESAKVAAYFASVQAAKLMVNLPGNTEGFISVWALNISALESLTRNFPDRIISVRAPWSSNPNLLAQKGLFTLHVHPLTPHADAVFSPLDETIQRIFRESTNEIKVPMLYQLCLHVKQSGCLLRLLHQEGIDAASIFPGYLGITQSMKERPLYRS